eukprot:m.1267060 g.1267060  ORF g.1267060 m.1267060 type:complete len:98 (-) comp24742_c0_seq3:4694-4987(-)
MTVLYGFKMQFGSIVAVQQRSNVPAEREKCDKRYQFTATAFTLVRKNKQSWMTALFLMKGDAAQCILSTVWKSYTEKMSSGLFVCEFICQYAVSGTI